MTCTIWPVVLPAMCILMVLVTLSGCLSDEKVCNDEVADVGRSLENMEKTSAALRNDLATVETKASALRNELSAVESRAAVFREELATVEARLGTIRHAKLNEDAARKKVEEDAAAAAETKQMAEEATRQKAEAEEAAARKKEEEAAAAAAKKKAKEEAAARKKEEEAAAAAAKKKAKEEEAAHKKAEEEATARKKAEATAASGRTSSTGSDVGSNSKAAEIPKAPVATPDMPGQLVFEPVEVLESPRIEDVQMLIRSSAKAIPLVLKKTGILDSAKWTADSLTSICGERPLRSDSQTMSRRDGPPCLEMTVAMQIRKSGQSKWIDNFGGLGQVSIPQLDSFKIRKLKDLMDHQKKAKPNNALYLHDASIANLCPELGKRLQVPSFFPVEGNKLFNMQEMCPPSHPSIFVGGNASRTLIHIDSENTRFWMVMLQGRKRWYFVHPDDQWRLYPTGAREIRFRVDLVDPDIDRWPLLNGLRVFQTVTGPGDIMFVPEGWPHQVENLEPTVAYSMNYMDEHNLVRYQEDLWSQLGESDTGPSSGEAQVSTARAVEFFHNREVISAFKNGAKKARKRGKHWQLQDFWSFWKPPKVINLNLQVLMSTNEQAVKSAAHDRDLLFKVVGAGKLAPLEKKLKSGTGNAFLSRKVAFHRVLGRWMTILDLALFLGKDDIVEMLFQHNASVLSKDSQFEGQCTSGVFAPPLFWALLSGRESLVSVLLRNGADPSYCLFKGLRSLHVASVLGLEDLLKSLPSTGVNCQDARGLSAFFYARQSENSHLTDLLIEKGCVETAADLAVGTATKEILSSVRDFFKVGSACRRGTAQCAAGDEKCRRDAKNYRCSHSDLTTVSAGSGGPR